MLNLNEEHFETQQNLSEGILSFNDDAFFSLSTVKQYTIGFKLDFFDPQTGSGMFIPSDNCEKVIWIYIYS
jgi:hypothetical protein